MGGELDGKRGVVDWLDLIGLLPLEAVLVLMVAPKWNEVEWSE